tara:strand:+ start:520 stop:873 length:354 start_codon:yes stop_codon:yes gene_type:complete
MANYTRKPGRLKINSAGELPELPATSKQDQAFDDWWEESRSVLNRQREEAEDEATPTSIYFESADEWKHTHALGRYPIAQVVDGTGTIVSPQSIKHNSVNEITVTHATALAGTLILY